MDRTSNILFRFHIDLPLFGGVVVMCALGLVVLYSASDQSLDVVLKQVARILIGFTVMIAVAQVPPRRLARWAPALYVVGLVLLGLVLIVGIGRGAQRWLDFGVLRFQPSELMKLAVPLTVAGFLADKVLPPSLRTLVIALVLALLPAAMIIEQPDLGTAILVATSGLFVLFFAGISWRFIRNSTILALAAAPLAWFSMHDYQRRRVLTLFDPGQDPLGAGYHIIQSTIAVGSGGVYGKGWLNGTQSHLEFLPERATDFIFAVYCEEFGLIGVAVMLIAYAMIIVRGIQIALDAQEMFGRLIAASLVLTLFIYLFVNMGMVTGQLPVVGVPLPMVSYGGTSLVTILAGFGILMSVQTHRKFIAET
ncbi:MAG: rod shape-determining protein RodA [Gammaproteobacteria bacterium]|nr:rod shape-determining protein RodA [Gammaproteobacteria bacterium]MCP5199227.1 rod shape-determining protein RodA [Gammaproteobacteria bacterium]